MSVSRNQEPPLMQTGKALSPGKGKKKKQRGKVLGYGQGKGRS